MIAFIVTEGGKKIGTGHITRCLSLYDALGEAGFETKLVVNGGPLVKTLLRNKNYKLFNWLKDRNRLFSLMRGADTVIIDSYLAAYDFYEKISEIARSTIYIDDNKRMTYPNGIVLNTNVYAGKIRYPEKKGLKYLLGSRYAALRKEFTTDRKKIIKKNIRSIMLTFGSNDPKCLTVRILKFLNKNYPGVIKNVIVGTGFHNADKLKPLGGSKTNFIYNPSTKKMKKAMLESDIAISAGGQTLYELACMGTPTVGICVTQNQLKNVKGCHEAGFLENIGWYNASHILDKLEKAIENLKPYKERLKRSNKGRMAVDGKGRIRLCKILSTMGERI